MQRASRIALVSRGGRRGGAARRQLRSGALLHGGPVAGSWGRRGAGSAPAHPFGGVGGGLQGKAPGACRDGVVVEVRAPTEAGCTLPNGET